MAVRLRKIDGELTALCAAEHPAEPGDFYIDDAQDHALREKYRADFKHESKPTCDCNMCKAVKRAGVEKGRP